MHVSLSYTVKIKVKITRMVQSNQSLFGLINPTLAYSNLDGLKLSIW